MGIVTVTVNVPDAPAARVPKLHETVPALPTAGAVHDPPGALYEANVVFTLLASCGMTAATVVLDTAVAPLLT